MFNYLVFVLLKTTALLLLKMEVFLSFQVRSLSKVHVNTLRDHGWTLCKSKLLSQKTALQCGDQAPVTLAVSACGW